MNPDLVRRITGLEQWRDGHKHAEAGRSLVEPYLRLPGLCFFAPMSVVGAAGRAVDLTFQSPGLTNNGNAPFGYDGVVPYCSYNGTTQYHNIADNAAHDIIGNEAYIANPGLTIGMWVQPKTLPAAITRLFSKGTTTGGARSYALATTGTNTFILFVSTDGTNVIQVLDTVAFEADTWYFLAARYNPSAELKIYVGTSTGLRTNTETASIPATLFNSATGLAIGGQADGTGFSNIWASMCFICVEKLDDMAIGELFEATRKSFKV